jgi:hypothetical protein
METIFILNLFLFWMPSMLKLYVSSFMGTAATPKLFSERMVKEIVISENISNFCQKMPSALCLYLQVVGH